MWINEAALGGLLSLPLPSYCSENTCPGRILVVILCISEICISNAFLFFFLILFVSLFNINTFCYILISDGFSKKFFIEIKNGTYRTNK